MRQNPPAFASTISPFSPTSEPDDDIVLAMKGPTSSLAGYVQTTKPYVAITVPRPRGFTAFPVSAPRTDLAPIAGNTFRRGPDTVEPARNLRTGLWRSTGGA